MIWSSNSRYTETKIYSLRCVISITRSKAKFRRREKTTHGTHGLCWYPRPKAHRSNIQAKDNIGATQPTAKKKKEK
jgi:hypothetical protein